MNFGSMNEYRPLADRRRLAVPHEVSRASSKEMLIRVAAFVCVLIVAAAAFALG
jgi:hypothetical protein